MVWAIVWFQPMRQIRDYSLPVEVDFIGYNSLVTRPRKRSSLVESIHELLLACFDHFPSSRTFTPQNYGVLEWSNYQCLAIEDGVPLLESITVGIAQRNTIPVLYWYRITTRQRICFLFSSGRASICFHYSYLCVRYCLWTYGLVGLFAESISHCQAIIGCMIRYCPVNTASPFLHNL